jgi:HlyD family secretion protein
MTNVRRRALTAVLVLLIGAALWFFNLQFRQFTGPTVNVETIETRALEALVSASGKIQPQLSVDISASTVGRVMRLAVSEGDRVEAGDFLLQIDPEALQAMVDRSEAGLEAARSAQRQARVGVDTARVNLGIAQDNLQRQRDLWASQLTTRETLERAENDVTLRERELQAREIEVATQEQRVRQDLASLESVRYDLTKVTIVAPISGIVTRRTIEEGETVVVGTMNNQGTVLMTIADLSVIEAEVEVDETDIPAIAIGQHASVSIDAIPDRTFAGRVTEIGNSPIQSSGTSQATNFKVVVTLNDEVPGIRPGFTCTADVTTATRAAAVAVPIQAMTVREFTLDASGAIVRRSSRTGVRRGVEPQVAAAELAPGETREELEGVFVVRQNTAAFVPVETGIAGERYFEVLSGLQPGDRVIVGPFSEVRELDDGVAVRVEESDPDV